MSGLRSWATAVAGLSVLAGGLGCTAGNRSVPPPRETVSNVSVLVVQRRPMPDYLEVSGTVHAAQTSQLASQIMGTVTAIRVHEGDRVRRGQTLVVIDSAQQQAGMDRAQAGVAASGQDVAAADAEVALAGSTLKRYEALFAKKSVSPQEYEEVKTRFAAAQARRDAAVAARAQAEAGMAQARSSLGYTNVRAPFDGVVTAKLADVGSMAAPGVPLLVVEDPRRLRLEVTVDESSLSAAHLGQAVPVSIDALGGRDLSGKVVQVVPAADIASRSFVVKIDLPAVAGLYSGTFGRARFTRGERNGMVIPETAVIDRGQLRGVYVVGDDQLANLRYVSLGTAVEGRYEVLSGLESGERIVEEPGTRELSGKRVEAR